MPTVSRRARARLVRRPRKRARRDRIDLHALIFDHAGMLRPMAELEGLLKQARASARVRTTALQVARKLWQADYAPQLDQLRLVEFIDAKDGEEDI